MRLAGPIKDPVGWLIGLGLPQRQQCGDVRCDDRVLLDSGQDCPRCAERQEDRRDQHRAVAAAVDAAMPGASEAKRRAATATQLHQDVTARAWAQVHKWDQVRARQAAAAQTLTEAAPARPEDQVPATPVTLVALPAPRPAAAPVPEIADVDDDQELVLEDLTREQVLDWRNRAAADHQIGSRWRRLPPGRQALLALAHLRMGHTYAQLAAGFGIGTTTAYRYASEAVEPMAGLAPTLADAIRERRRHS